VKREEEYELQATVQQLYIRICMEIMWSVGPLAHFERGEYDVDFWRSDN
jgi:hypothetical protein